MSELVVKLTIWVPICRLVPFVGSLGRIVHVGGFWEPTILASLAVVGYSLAL